MNNKRIRKKERAKYNIIHYKSPFKIPKNV